MGLREQLSQRSRRTAAVRIDVGGAAETTEMAQSQRVLLAHAQAQAADPGERDPAVLAQDVETARDKLAVLLALAETQHAVIHLQALPAADWEAALASFPAPEGSADTCDWAAALPPILAASCTDDDGDDAEWWAGELAGPAWSAGQISTLRQVVLELNLRPFEVALDPKG